MKNAINLHADHEILNACIAALMEQAQNTVSLGSEFYENLARELVVIKRHTPANQPLVISVSVAEGFMLIGALARVGVMEDFRAETLNAIGFALNQDDKGE